LPEGTSVAFALGGVARFEMIRRDRAGRQLGGYGSAPPVHVDPPRAARLSIREGDVEHLDVHLEMVGDPVHLRPLGGPPVELVIVEPSADDTLSLAMIGQEGGETELTSLEPGARSLVSIIVRRADGTRLLGTIDRATLVSTTPDACTATSMEAFYADGIYEIARIAAGPCTVEIQSAMSTVPVTLPDASSIETAQRSAASVAQR
jgi:hypothetical protein